MGACTVWVGRELGFVEGLVGQRWSSCAVRLCLLCVCALGCGAWLVEAWGCCGWSQQTSRPACISMPQQHSRFARCPVCPVCAVFAVHTVAVCAVSSRRVLVQGGQRRQGRCISCTSSGSDWQHLVASSAPAGSPCRVLLQMAKRRQGRHISYIPSYWHVLAPSAPAGCWCRWPGGL